MDLYPWIAPLTSVLGLSVLFWRFGPVISHSFKVGSEPSHQSSDSGSGETVSVVIPARNEEANLPKLLQSIVKLRWENLEVLIVDDESTDGTSTIVDEFIRRYPEIQLRLIQGQPRPPGWTGKNWACHQGFAQTSGRWILFTDADTNHEPESLEIAIKQMIERRLDLLSAAPYHRCEALWEKLMGPFHMFLFLSTAAFSEPRPGRVFAIGQYLLFRREAYLKQGGHEKIKDVLCDDLELARHCMENGGKFRVEGRERLYQVRMYERFADFISGWRRIFRLGFRHAKFTSSIEVYLAIAALTAGLQFFMADALTLGLMAVSAGVVAFIQPRFGNFSFFGVLLLPVSLIVFIFVSLLALYDLVMGRQYVWRGRAYLKSSD